MHLTRTARILATVMTLALLTACSSATDGQGRPPTRPSTGATSGDFPSSADTPTPSDATPSDSTPSTPAGSTDTGSPAPSKRLRSVSVTAPDGTGYLVDIWAERTDPTCTDHAYGQPVVDYLNAHACGGLHRLLATTTVDGRAVGLAISDLGFKGVDPQVYTTAGQFAVLVKQNGTGNIDDLMRSGSRLPAGPSAVPNPDVTTAQAQDDGVEIVDAWYLTGATESTDPALITMATSLFLQLN
ncbi:MAG: hypothetical protein ABI301_07320 [Jatrophihabitantaceae bacterium]